MKELVFPRLMVPAVERDPDKLAVIGDYGQSTYRATFSEHLSRVRRLASALPETLGVRPGDRFAVLAENSHRFLELWHVALFGAGVINPLNMRLADQELEFILNDSGTEVIFVDSSFAAVVDRIRTRTALRTVVLLDDGRPDSPVPHDVRYEELIGGHEPAVLAEPDEDDIAALMYTGGTLGRPKGVLMSQRSQVLTVYRMEPLIGYFSREESYLQNTPMFHAAGCLGVLGMPGAGRLVVIQPRFEPGAAIAAMEKYQVTRLGAIPTMVSMLIGHPDFAPEKAKSVRGIGYGGSPISEGLMERFLAAFPNAELYQLFGMTEMMGLVSGLRGWDHVPGSERLRSAGRPLPGTQVEIRDPGTDIVLPSGEDGEIVIQSGGGMSGYWNMPEPTAEVLRGGWYHSGDIGHLDADGYLYVTDRLKDMIVTGGENVYSTEVESVISTHPDILQVAVIGVPSDEWGEAVHAVVVPRPNAPLTEDDVLVHARTRLRSYKVPKSVEIRSEPLPLSGAMKVLKRTLREQYSAS